MHNTLRGGAESKKRQAVSEMGAPAKLRADTSKEEEEAVFKKQEEEEEEEEEEKREKLLKLANLGAPQAAEESNFKGDLRSTNIQSPPSSSLLQTQKNIDFCCVHPHKEVSEPCYSRYRKGRESKGTVVHCLQLIFNFPLLHLFLPPLLSLSGRTKKGEKKFFCV